VLNKAGCKRDQCTHVLCDARSDSTRESGDEGGSRVQLALPRGTVDYRTLGHVGLCLREDKECHTIFERVPQLPLTGTGCGIC